MHASLHEVLVHSRDGAGEVDGGGKVFDDEGLEAEAGGGGGGVADAEIVGDAGEEEAGEGALAEVGGEAGGSAAVVLEEGGVAVSIFSVALPQDQLGLREVEGGVEVSARGSLDAVVGPEDLGAVGSFDDIREGLLAVGAGEGDVTGGMPVLGAKNVVEATGEGVDAGDEIEAAVDLKRSAFEEEVDLHVDDEEGVVRGEVHGCSLWET